MERNAFATHLGTDFRCGGELGAGVGGGCTATGRKIDHRTDGTQRIGEGHACAPVKDASAGAQIRANLHLGDHALRRNLDERDSHESREKRLEQLPYLCEIHRCALRGLPPFLKRWQAVAEAHPREIVTQPGVMRWRKQIRVVETAHRYVDRRHIIGMLIRQWSSACRAERATYRLRRLERGRLPTKQLELRFRERDPRDHRRRCYAPATLTMAHHLVCRRSTDTITNRTAEAASFSDVCWHRDSFPQLEVKSAERIYIYLHLRILTE